MCLELQAQGIVRRGNWKFTVGGRPIISNGRHSGQQLGCNINCSSGRPEHVEDGMEHVVDDGLDWTFEDFFDESFQQVDGQISNLATEEKEKILFLSFITATYNVVGCCPWLTSSASQLKMPRPVTSVEMWPMSLMFTFSTVTSPASKSMRACQ